MWKMGLPEAAQFPEKEYINGIFVAVYDGTFTENYIESSVLLREIIFEYQS
jgi:hypothetical protein